MTSEIVFVMPSFNGVARCRYELETIKRNDPTAFQFPIFVVEDPCTNLGEEYAAKVKCDYDHLRDDFMVEVIHLSEWSNMHGAARKSFDIAHKRYDPKWIVYLGDDLAITPHALSNMTHFLSQNELETVGLVQFPYWNAHDLCKNVEYGDWYGAPKLFWTKERDFYASMDWTDQVPHNPHWDGDGCARPYINVNGAGFACRTSMYYSVGGFQEGTWCLDETISVKCWLQTPYSCVCLPGPTLVHYFGAATMSGPPPHDLHTSERWEEAMGMTKEQGDRLCRLAMQERQEKVMREMRAANYWREA